MKIEQIDLQNLKLFLTGGKIDFQQLLSLLNAHNLRHSIFNDVDLTFYAHRTIPELIEDGKYDFAHLSVNGDNFPIKSPETVVEYSRRSLSGRLFHFNHETSGDNVIRIMDQSGFQPASFARLLIFGARYPWWQKFFTIVSLESIWYCADGFRYVPKLSADEVERKLDIIKFGGIFPAHILFLGIPKY